MKTYKDNYLKKEMIVALDIETTGLPERKCFDEYFPPEEIVHYDRCRVLSVALLSDHYSKYAVISPSGDFDVDPIAEDLHHISKEIAVENGISVKRFFSKDVLNLLRKADLIVGHNTDFDKSVLMSELYRNGLTDIADLLGKKKFYCTMRNAKQKLNLTKHPRLQELTQLLFFKSIDGCHHAMSDAKATWDCYKRLTGADKKDD